MCSRLKKAQEAYATKNIPLDLSLVSQNQSEESSGSKPLNKKQQKVATAAKKEAAKTAFAAKKAAQEDTTLDRLLNDTIPEEDDASDESFAPVESSDNDESDNQSGEDDEEEEEEVVEPEVTSKPLKKRTNEVAFPKESLKTSKAKQPPVNLKTKVNAKPEPKPKQTKKQKLNESPVSNNSSVNTSTDSPSSSGSSSPGTPPKSKKTKKQLVLAPSSPDTPVVAKTKKIANAGIQKRSHKAAGSSETNAKKVKKSAVFTGATKEELEKTAAKLCNKVSASDIKRKAKAPRR